MERRKERRKEGISLRREIPFFIPTSRSLTIGSKKGMKASWGKAKRNEKGRKKERTKKEREKEGKRKRKKEREREREKSNDH